MLLVSPMRDKPPLHKQVHLRIHENTGDSSPATNMTHLDTECQPTGWEFPVLQFGPSLASHVLLLQQAHAECPETEAARQKEQ